MFQEEPRAVAGAGEYGGESVGKGIRKKQDKGELVMDSFVNTLDRWNTLPFNDRRTVW